MLKKNVKKCKKKMIKNVENALKNENDNVKKNV